MLDLAQRVVGVRSAMHQLDRHVIRRQLAQLDEDAHMQLLADLRGRVDATGLDMGHVHAPAMPRARAPS